MSTNHEAKQFLDDILPFFNGRSLTYVDVGAYGGHVFEQALASGLKIREAHLIEPNPTSLKAAQDTIPGLFRGSSLNFHQLAMGATPGRVRMHAAKTMTRVLETVAASSGNSAEDSFFEVECSTLDRLSVSFVERHISLLKIDVEGYEANVLKGAERLLQEQRVDVIYIEAGMDPEGEQQCYYRKIEDILLGHKYRLFRIYEQMHEWIQDSPFLRRVNLAFMSQRFAANNPYMVSKKLQDAQQHASQLKKELAEIQAQVAPATRERDTLREQATALTKGRAEALEQVKSLQARVSQSDELRKKLTDELDVTRNDFAGIEARLSSVTRDLETSEKARRALLSEHEIAIRQKQELESQITAARIEAERLQGEVRALVLRQETLTSELAIRGNENQSLHEVVQETVTTRDRAVGETSTLRAEQARLLERLDRQQSDNNRLESQLIEAVTAQRQLSKEMTRTASEAAAIKSEISDLSNDLSRQRLAQLQLEERLTEEKALQQRLSSERDRAVDEIALLKTQLSGLADELSRQRSDNLHLAEQLTEGACLQQNLSSDRDRALAASALLRTEAEQTDERIRTLEAEIASGVAQGIETAAAMEAGGARITELERLNGQLAKAKAGIEARVSELEQQKRDLVQIRTRLDARVVELENENKEATAETELVLTQLHKVQEELERYYLENRSLKHSLRAARRARRPKGAADRVREHLSYRLGTTLIQSKRGFVSLFWMPWSLLRERRRFIADQAKQTAWPPLSAHIDAEEAEKVIKDLPYRLGDVIIAHGRNPLRWLGLPFALRREVRAFKQERAIP